MKNIVFICSAIVFLFTISSGDGYSQQYYLETTNDSVFLEYYEGDNLQIRSFIKNVLLVGGLPYSFSIIDNRFDKFFVVNINTWKAGLGDFYMDASRSIYIKYYSSSIHCDDQGRWFIYSIDLKRNTDSSFAITFENSKGKVEELEVTLDSDILENFGNIRENICNMLYEKSGIKECIYCGAWPK